MIAFSNGIYYNLPQLEFTAIVDRTIPTLIKELVVSRDTGHTVSNSSSNRPATNRTTIR